jgi:hypothetical protein
MLAEGYAGFFGDSLGIGSHSPKKLLDILGGLLIAVWVALTWLDVMLHFRLHF